MLVSIQKVYDRETPRVWVPGDWSSWRVIDGDTVEVSFEVKRQQEIDFGFGVKVDVLKTGRFKKSLRLLGINAPEAEGTTKKEGLASKARLLQMLMVNDVMGDLYFHTFKPDKYGRWLVVFHGSEYCLNEELVREGLAVEYSG